MKRIIIIGAGPAGLTAAYELLKKKEDLHIDIFEASEYIGGISRTHQFEGNRMDLGGHRFFTKNEEVMKLWQELMPLQGMPASDDLLLNRMPRLSKGGPDPEKTDDVLLSRHRISRIFFLKKFFDYPISIKWGTFANMGFLRTMQAGFGYLHAMIFKKKEDSLENFYINRFGKPLYQMFFEDYTEKVWGIHPSHISADWGAQRVKGLSLMKALVSIIMKPFRKGNNVETSLIEEFYYPKKGPGSLYEKMADEVIKLGGFIHYHSEVKTICCDESGIHKVIVEEQNGEKREYEADTVFSSMPIKDLIEAMGEYVPKNVSDIAKVLPYRDFMTVGLLVKEIELKNQTKYPAVSGIVPDTWIYVQDRDVRMGRLQIFNNWSPYMVADNEHTVFMGLEYFCNEGDSFWNMKDEEFAQMAIDELCKINVIRADAVVKSEVVRVKKAYPAYFGSYEQFPVVEGWLKKIENLYCIGRNGQHRYNNMDHSMLTAIEAVKAYGRNGEGKDRIWEVNTEEEYHETK